ncbi:major facilitator superfamily domain-containing protein 4A isoform 2-T2 [Hipposideros larvatus]|uniref:Major facilitator superfamily domain-containing protein 4A n=1 Tax=Hipposideros armiger TaxID=186990 RepID=A0A8B7RVZ8_HIPAR|nr:PREDICTED: major facilitator superfamily domain-containing protein 4A isoform X2 [Hipposideros armiger]
MGCDGRLSGLLRRNLQPTLTYWSVFFSFGLCIAFLGPTLLDLRCQTHSSLSQISWVFFSQQLCLLLGSAIGGVFKRTLAQSLWALFTSSLAISLVFAVIPLCSDVKVLASVMALAGLAMGCIDTVANMQLVRIYQRDSAIFLQVLHFFVGFGALLSPLIADPFLSETDCLPANSTANATSGSHLFHASRVLGQHHTTAQTWSNQTLPGVSPQNGAGTRVSYAFWIMALINGAYSTFVYSYAVEKPLSVGHKVAGYLPSLFWGFITLGQLISIPVSSKVNPATMVFINVVGVVVTYLVLLIFSYNVIFLFVGTASLGLFLSSTFPSMLAYTEDTLQYKGCATTVLVTGAGLGEMSLQMLVGWIFQAQGSYSFLVCGVIFGCLAFTFYILLLFFHRMHHGRSSEPIQDKPLGMESSERYQR